MNDYVKIFSEIPIIVRRLKSLLEEAEITSIIKDHLNSGNLAGFGSLGNSIELFVLNSDLEKATSIIEEFKKEIEE